MRTFIKRALLGVLIGGGIALIAAPGQAQLIDTFTYSPAESRERR